MAGSSFVPVLLGLLAVAAVTNAQSQSSCQGHCASGISVDQSCYCDKPCASKGDCCTDYSSFCKDYSGLQVNSCKGRCFGASLKDSEVGEADGLCYCDPISTVYGDSCPDYLAVCSNVPAPPPLHLSGSCADHCGAYDHPDQSSSINCYCDAVCVHNGDCCPDFSDQCQGTCDGFCGGTGSDGSCYCDSVCSAANDCCADFHDHCNYSQLDSSQVTCQHYCNTCNLGCCCDIYCEYLGDCCPDKKTFCTTEGNENPNCVGNNECTGNAISIPLVIDTSKGFPIHLEGSTIGYTSNNTFGEDECHDKNAPDVFYSFVPPKDMTVKVSLCGSTTNFKSALYIVDAGVSKTLNYECNNKTDRAGCGLDQAEVVAFVKGQHQYFFVVDGKGGDNGAYGLTISEELGNTQYNPIKFQQSDLPYDVEGDTTFYTDQFPATKDNSYGCDFGGTNDIFYFFQSQQNTTLSIQLCADFASTLIVAQEVLGGGLQVMPPTVCLNESVSLTECQIGFSTATVPVAVGGNYMIIIKGYNYNSVPTFGKYRLLVSNAVGDSISNPIVIPDVSTSFTTSIAIGDFVDSFKAEKSCTKADIGASPDVVFSYSPATDVDVTLSTCGSEFDTLLSVITVDPTTKKQTVLGCNDDVGTPNCIRGSQLTVHLNSKTQYFFIVDGFDKSIAEEKMNFTMSVGQGCSSKDTACLIPFPFPKGTTTYQVFGPSQVILSIPPASLPTGNCPGLDSSAKTAGFYRIAPGSSGKNVQVSVCPTKGDAALQVIREDANGVLTLIKCDHGSASCKGGGSAVTFEADALESYLIVIQTTSSELEYSLTVTDNGVLGNTCKVMEDGKQVGDLCGHVGASGTCYCDHYAALPQLGNACSDFSTVCASKNLQGSCDAKTDCGHMSSSGPCLCSPMCTTFNNCCQDQSSVCPTDPPKKANKDGSSFEKAIQVLSLPFGYAATTSTPSTLALPPTECGLNSTQIKQTIFKLNTASFRYGTAVKLCGLNVGSAVYVVAYNHVDLKSNSVQKVDKALCVDSAERFGCSDDVLVRTELDHSFEYYFIVLTKQASSFYLEIDVEYKSLISSPPPPPPSPPPSSNNNGNNGNSGNSGNNGNSGNSGNNGNKNSGKEKGSKSKSGSGNGTAIALGIILPLLAIGGLVGFAVYYRSANPRKWDEFVGRFKGSKGHSQLLDEYQEFDEYDSHPKGVGL